MRAVLAIVIALEIIALTFAAPIFRLTGRGLPSLEISLEQPARSLSAQGSV